MGGQGERGAHTGRLGLHGETRGDGRQGRWQPLLSGCHWGLRGRDGDGVSGEWGPAAWGGEPGPPCCTPRGNSRVPQKHGPVLLGQGQRRPRRCEGPCKGQVPQAGGPCKGQVPPAAPAAHEGLWPWGGRVSWGRRRLPGDGGEAVLRARPHLHPESSQPRGLCRHGTPCPHLGSSSTPARRTGAGTPLGTLCLEISLAAACGSGRCPLSSVASPLFHPRHLPWPGLPTRCQPCSLVVPPIPHPRAAAQGTARLVGACSRGEGDASLGAAGLERDGILLPGRWSRSYSGAGSHPCRELCFQPRCRGKRT